MKYRIDVKKRPFLTTLGIAGACAITTLASMTSALAGEFGNKHTLVIGIDGVRPDALQFANTPNLDNLIATGAVTYDAFAGGVLGTATQQATSSGPGWSSILTGVWVDKHGVSSNSFAGRDYTNYPHFFSRIHETNPNAYLSSIVVWDPINDYIEKDSPNAADFSSKHADDVELVNATVNHLGNADPDVLFLHFDEVDHAGHGYGYSIQVPQYVSAIEGVDVGIGTILTALQNRPNYANEDWQILVTTDHGGIGSGHGGQTIDERQIFIINNAANVVNAQIGSGTGHTVIPTSVLTHLGLPINPAWGWEDSKGFGYGPIYPTDLQASFDVATSEVSLNWNAQIASDITGYEIHRDGVLIATVGAGVETYTDILTLPPTPQEVSYTYTLTSTGGNDSAAAPVLEDVIIHYTGDLTDDLVAYYSFNNNYNDSSGLANVNNASVGGGVPAFTGGMFGEAVSLDGVDDYVTLGTASDFDFSDGSDFSLSFWYRVSADQQSDSIIIGNKNWANGRNQGWLVEANNGGGDDIGLQLGDGTNRADSAGKDVDFNQWHHVVAIFRQGATMDMYVDGELSHSTPISHVSSSINAGLATNIGQDGTGIYSDFTLMDMDDLGIWRRALASSEVTTIYNEAQQGIPLAGLTDEYVDLPASRVLFLPLDGDAQDLSSAGNNGTVSGAPIYVAGQDSQALELLDTATPHQYVDLGNPTSLQFGAAQDFSVAVWVNNLGGFADNRAIGGSANDPAIMSNKDWNAGGNKGWVIAAGADGRWQWNMGDGASRVDYDGPAGEINDGNWHLLIVTHDRDGNATLYYDGAKVATRDISGIGDITSGLSTAVGTDGALGSVWANWFTGKIDNPMIWDRVINSAEVQALYDGETGGGSSDPVVIFSDDFESGDLNAWNTQNGDASINGGSSFNGSNGAELKKSTWIEKSVSTVGYSDVSLKYIRKTAQYDAGENLTVQWFDGTSWVTVETTQETSWLAIDAELGAAANNNAALKIRFQTNASAKKEKASIDDVVLEGIQN